MSIRESKLWFWHMASGAALLVLLGVHTLIQHFDDILKFFGFLDASSPDPLSWAGVLGRMQSISHTAVYIGLLGFGLFHGLYGLRSLLLEVPMPVGLKKASGVVIVLLGVAIGAFGVYTIVGAYLNREALAAAASAVAAK